MNKKNENLFFRRSIQHIYCLLAIMMIGFTTYAQTDYTLRGNVVDDFGSPISGDNSN